MMSMEEQAKVGSAIQQSSLGVKAEVGEGEVEGRSIRFLQVTVSLGIRLVAPTERVPDRPVLFYIEAKFAANYEILEEVDAELVTAFSKFNSVHNVWPFWRQHVYDIAQRGYLPSLDVPLFSGKDLSLPRAQKAAAQKQSD